MVRHHVDVDAVHVQDGVARWPNSRDHNALVEHLDEIMADAETLGDLEQMTELDLAGYGQGVDVTS
jgi:hypothetical protein